MIGGRSASFGVARWLCRRLHDRAAASASVGVPPLRPTKIYRRLSALGRTGGTVAGTLQEYIAEGRRLSKIEMIKCIKELRKYGQYQHALEISQWMEEQNVRFSAYDYALRLDLISKTQGVDAAESYFGSLPNSAKDLAVYGTLLNCYCKNGLEEKALSLFKEMEALCFAPSTLSFNNIMSLYVKVGKPEKVPILVEEMKQRGVPRDTFTYNIWMNSYGRRCDVEGVEKVWNELLNNDPILCDWTVHSNMADNYVRAGLFSKAVAALAKLENVMKINDLEAYHYLISLYASAGNLKEVSRIWSSLKRSFPKPLNRSYSIICSALQKLGDSEGLLKCLTEWLSTASEYDPRLANLILNGFLENGKYEEAVSIFDGAKNKVGGHFCKAREVFMIHLLKEGKVDLALDHLSAAVANSGKEKWVPQSATLNYFLKYLTEQKDVNSAEAFYKILKQMETARELASQALLQTYEAAGKSQPGLTESNAEPAHES
ncbi:hypothetical protein MLD38_005857 [Melastoma candidum]|uniref:Uncharacterized protein n=1 Tax=Melastoma candidum TaxID=119954 RepID=A0ACB9RQ72_9MYRT|nr:hypothetical protein MLD38_005857 [Melastoma candidum]